MKKYTTIILMAMLTLSTFPVFAGDLSFPTTADEIVEILSIRDGKTVYQGITYESEKGRVYKVINGNRYRLRGLQVVSLADSDIFPRVGALIHFDFDSAEIRPESYILIDEFGKAFKGGLSSATVMIEGHTDSKGTMEYNQTLSVKRAQAIADYLKDHHAISSLRMIIKGYGETKPIDVNDTEEGRFRNRRVEFIRVE